MTNTNLSAFSSSGEHLSPEQIYQYLDDQLPAGARHEVELHLQECSFCNEALEGLAMAPTDNSKQIVFELNHHLKKRTRPRRRKSPLQDLKNWALAAAILMLLIIAAIIVWFQIKHNSNIPNTQKSPQQEQIMSPDTE